MKLGYFTFSVFTLSLALLVAGCNNTEQPDAGDTYETDVDEKTEVEENGREEDEMEVNDEVNEAPPDLGEVKNFPSSAPDGEPGTSTGNETDDFDDTEGVGGEAIEEEPAQSLPE